MPEPALASDRIPSAIALRLFAAGSIAVMSACIHALGAGVPVGQIIFWRSAVALVPIGLYMAARGGLRAGVATRHPRLHLVRSLVGAMAMALYFFSLRHLSVANAQALSFLTPLFALPLAGLVLGERLGLRVLIAGLLGFGGVLAMLWTALEAPGQGALAGVAAGLVFALLMAFIRIHVRMMTATESAVTIAFWFTLTTTLVGLATLPFGWAPMDGGTSALLVAAGLIAGIGSIAANESAARAPVSVLAPLDYSSMVWALAIDAAVFGLWPDGQGLAGIAAITAAGLIVAFRRSAPRRRFR